MKLHFPFFHKKKKKEAPDERMLLLKSELDFTLEKLETAYSNFSYATVPELVDSSIYEVNSLWQRYHYLLHQFK